VDRKGISKERGGGGENQAKPRNEISQRDGGKEKRGNRKKRDCISNEREIRDERMSTFLGYSGRMQRKNQEKNRISIKSRENEKEQ